MKKKNLLDQMWNGRVQRVFDFLLVVDNCQGELSRFPSFRLVKVSLFNFFIYYYGGQYWLAGCYSYTGTGINSPVIYNMLKSSAIKFNSTSMIMIGNLQVIILFSLDATYLQFYSRPFLPVP